MWKSRNDRIRSVFSLLKYDLFQQSCHRMFRTREARFVNRCEKMTRDCRLDHVTELMILLFMTLSWKSVFHMM